MSLYNDASLLLIPSGYKAGTVFSQKPTDGDGDLTFTRNSMATRVNSDGLIESVAANVPRLDYSQGSCPALLLEPQRTNLALYSEQFDNAAWTKDGSSITANAEISPDGYQNADILIEGDSLSGLNHRVAQAINITSGTFYAMSIFVKRGTGTRDLCLVCTPAGIRVYFNLSNGTVANENLGSGKVEVYGDYYRCIAVGQANASGFNAFRYAISNGTTTSSESYTGNGTSSLIIYGAQLEQGAYATSYIPTTSATVTRLADACSKTGISSLIGQTEGVLYWEGVVLNQTDILAINRSTVNGIYITKGSGNLYRAAIYNSSSGIQFADVGVKTTTTKIAIAYKSGDSALFVNGSKIGATNTSTINFSGALSELRLNDNYLIASAPQFTNKINIYNTRLSDSDCISLTTL